MKTLNEKFGDPYQFSSPYIDAAAREGLILIRKLGGERVCQITETGEQLLAKTLDDIRM